MNIDEWKRVAERHAGCPLKWTDRSCPWSGATAWADGPLWTYSIMMKHDPPAVRIRGTETIPLEGETCEPKPVPSVKEARHATTATESAVNGAISLASALPVLEQASFL